MTHYKKVIDYMKEHGSITVRQAFDELWINSPTKVLSDLSRKGYEIEREWVDTENSRYKRYVLKSEPAA